MAESRIRRWTVLTRFGLRTMLLAISLTCLWLGWWVNSARRQAAAVNELEQKGSYVDFIYSMGIGDTFPNSPPQAQWVPKWLHEQLGRHYFETIRAVRLGSPNEPDRRRLVDADMSVLRKLPGLRGLIIMLTNVTDEGLRQITNCQDLRVLMFWNNKKITDESMKVIRQLRNLHSLEADGQLCSDAGLAAIQDMRQLRELTLIDYRGNPGITDKGLEHIGNLENLELLSIQNAAITDDGLHHLEGLTSLRNLHLAKTNVTPEGVARLGVALPNCTITLK